MNTDYGIERAVLAIGELSASVRTLTTEVTASEQLRASKIQWIQKLLYVLVPAVVLLVIMAVSNFVLLSRINATAADAKSTNDLLVGCFQPGSRCAELNAKKTEENINQLRQTQFVIAICQRQNPVTDDPKGARVIACVQQYYPGFELPAKAR